MPNPASANDVAARWRVLTTEESQRAMTLLDDAWAIAITAVPTLEARLAAGTLSERLVVKTLANAVIRHMRNPDGKRSEQIDDYAYTRDSGSATGELFLSTTDIAQLAGRTTTAFNITPAGQRGTYADAERIAEHRAFWNLP